MHQNLHHHPELTIQCGIAFPNNYFMGICFLVHARVSVVRVQAAAFGIKFHVIVYGGFSSPLEFATVIIASTSTVITNQILDRGRGSRRVVAFRRLCAGGWDDCLIEPLTFFA